jgi:hypothetical protein
MLSRTKSTVPEFICRTVFLFFILDVPKNYNHE